MNTHACIQGGPYGVCECIYQEAEQIVYGKDGTQEQVKVESPGQRLGCFICGPHIEHHKQQAGGKLA